MAEACLKHSNLFKVKDPATCNHHSVKRAATNRKTDGQHPALTRVTTAGQAGHIRNPTTSFLTAATLIYAIGAGITAAAGHSLIHSLYMTRATVFDYRSLHLTVISDCSLDPHDSLCNSTPYLSTLAGGLARSLSSLYYSEPTPLRALRRS
jgi:hypothetical protein